jgi:dephospho-CoA kinase
MSGKFRVGLTGGIGSGKTIVANLFAALGVTIVDTDLLAREVVAPGSRLLREITAHFGMALLAADGSLDRQALRDRVFSDPAERKWLEALLHPAIARLTDARCEAATGSYVMVAIPLLVETDGKARFDRVLVVDCDPDLQLARLQARDGTTRVEAARMLAAQVTREQRLAVADDVIENNGDIALLREQVEKLHLQYLGKASAQSDRDAR